MTLETHRKIIYGIDYLQDIFVVTISYRYSTIVSTKCINITFTKRVLHKLILVTCVDAYDQIINDENEFDWKLELKRWIAPAKKNGSIFVEVDLSCWNQEGERIN